VIPCNKIRCTQPGSILTLNPSLRVLYVSSRRCTRRCSVVESVLVKMSEAERAAAVAAFTEIFADW